VAEIRIGTRTFTGSFAPVLLFLVLAAFFHRFMGTAEQ
jgi:hypothetical protein